MAELTLLGWIILGVIWIIISERFYFSFLQFDEDVEYKQIDFFHTKMWALFASAISMILIYWLYLGVRHLIENTKHLIIVIIIILVFNGIIGFFWVNTYFGKKVKAKQKKKILKKRVEERKAKKKKKKKK